MDGIKVIFLNVDGVLNDASTTRTTTSGCTFVEGEHLRFLKYIVNATKARVVLSGEWRQGRADAASSGDYLELKEELRRYGIHLYGCTPELPGDHRGMEIDQWLRERDYVSNFVILDDRCDLEPHKDHWVQVNADRGLGIAEVGKAIEILNDGQEEEWEIF